MSFSNKLSSFKDAYLMPPFNGALLYILAPWAVIFTVAVVVRYDGWYTDYLVYPAVGLIGFYLLQVAALITRGEMFEPVMAGLAYLVCAGINWAFLGFVLRDDFSGGIWGVDSSVMSGLAVAALIGGFAAWVIAVVAVPTMLAYRRMFGKTPVKTAPSKA